MFNRLIIAVLTLGLLLTFSSAAISSDNVPKHGLNPYETTNPDAPRYQDISIIEHETPAFHKPPNSMLEVGTPTTVLPPQYFCEFIDYSGGAATYYWKLPDVYGDTEMGMRFTPAEGYTCTLLATYIGVYGSYLGANPGAPDMLVTVYADDGFGLPGTNLGSVVIPNASLPTSGLAYVPVDLTSLGPLVFVDGEEFHVGVQTNAFVEPDTLAILSDDGSNGLLRSWEVWQGLHGFMAYDWGIDINFLIGVDLCCGLIPFTDCYTQEYNCGVAYYWPQPDDYGDDYFNMRFSVEGPETLMAVGVALYGPPTVGTADLDVFVWGDDGFGFPNLGDVIYSTTIPNASLAFFPSYNVVDLSGMNIVLTSDFHVGWSTNEASDPGGVLAGLSDDGSCGAGRSSEWWNGAFNSMLNDWGVDVNFLIFADLCRDQFSQCKWLSYLCNLAYFWRLPDKYGDIGMYQRFTPSGEGCRIEGVFIPFYWAGSEAGLPLYTYNSEVQVFAKDGVTGLPDPLTKLAGVILTPADYVLFPGGTYVDFNTAVPDPVLFDEDIWVGVESFAPDTLTGIRILSDDGSCGSLRSAENWAGLMGYMLDDWGIDINFYIEMYVCCVPLAERPCAPGDMWPALGGNFQRTFESSSGLGDMQANLTKAWQYDTDQLMAYASPVIYKDTMVGYFLDRVNAVDMNNGLEIWERAPDGFEIGSGVFCTPTIYNFDAYGVPITLVFVAGGDTKAMTALELGTGATWWTNNFLFHSNHFLTFGPSVVVDCAGVPVLIYSDDNGDVYAVEALTGSPYGGWVPNPNNYGGNVLNGLSSDGEGLVFIGTQGNVTNGNVTAIDACTGLALWNLQSTAGLQVGNLSSANTDGAEDFNACLTYEVFDNNPTLYAISQYSQDVVPPYEGGGIMYSLDALTGALNWANLTEEGWYAGASVDGSQIIYSSWTPWVPGYGDIRGPHGFNKESGNYTFTNTVTNPGLGDFWLMGGILTCETEAPDMYITQSRHEFVGFFRNTDGAMMFHRRWAEAGNGHRTPPVMDDGHLLVTYINHVVCLVPDIERPRLDLPSYLIEVPVEFGSPDHTIVTIPDAIGNMGGAPLTINSVTLTDIDNATVPPPSASIRMVNDELIDNMESIVNKFAKNSDAFRASFKDADGDVLVDNAPRVSRNNAAYVLPAWIYGVTYPTPGTVIPPQGSFNDSSSYIDIDIDIDGTQVPRGVTGFYAEISSNDPDYFLDNGAPDPQIEIHLVGGCLFSRVTLEFGSDRGENWWWVWNTPFVADGNESHSAEIDGDVATMWQGAYQFSKAIDFTPPGKPAGIFTPGVYTWARNWSSASPQVWQSLLPDPNCYDATCPPNHRTNVYLGDIAPTPGAAYEQIYGEVVAYAFVDSSQDFCEYDTLGNCLNWDWTAGEDLIIPYNGAWTAGFKGCAEVIGAYGQPLLNNFIIARFEMFGRYGPVDGIQFGAFMDYDLDYPNYNDIQVNSYDASISTGWVYNCNWDQVGEGFAWGMVKIPFGCGYDPMVNSHTVSADGGGWNDTGVWLDSIDYWMRTYSGLSHQQGPNPIDPIVCNADPSDREALFTLGNDLTFPATRDGGLIIGVAQFGMGPLDGTIDVSVKFDALEELAHTANAWCGFERGDMNFDHKIDLVDIAYLIEFVYCGGDGPYPFLHQGDVDCNGQVDVDDISYMMSFYFGQGPCPCGEWLLGGFTLP